MSTSPLPVPHYIWAGLDFMLDREGVPVLLEANRSSHMLGEYMHFHGDERPFELVAAAMNEAGGVPCLLWRRGDPFSDADEDACYIGKHLGRYLHRMPVICNVEDNQESRDALRARDGSWVRPGSIFRWWYGLPWSYERSGVRVINPNCLWVTVRDKLACYRTLENARHFRVPKSFAVDDVAHVRKLLHDHASLFENGFVLKPRTGWGGYGVQVADPGEQPMAVPAGYLLSERIVPAARNGRFWDVRVFVMGGVYLGGVQYSSHTPNTNYFQGGRPDRLDADTEVHLEAAALEAVELLNHAADAVHRLPSPLDSLLTAVVY